MVRHGLYLPWRPGSFEREDPQSCVGSLFADCPPGHGGHSREPGYRTSPSTQGGVTVLLKVSTDTLSRKGSANPGIAVPSLGTLTTARINQEVEGFRSLEHCVRMNAPIEGPRVPVGPGNPSIVSPPSSGRCDGPCAMDGCYRAKGNSCIESWQSISAALCFQRIP